MQVASQISRRLDLFVSLPDSQLEPLRIREIGEKFPIEEKPAALLSAPAKRGSLPAWAIGEFFGTFLLVFFGCGSVCAAVLTGAQVGVFQVAIVWGLGIATAIYLTGSLSGAHLNPAVTLALAAWNGFPWRRVPGYLMAQLLGAFAASAVLYFAFAGPLRVFEESHGIVRGQPGSEASAMIFGEFFPNPGGRPFTSKILAMIGPGLRSMWRRWARQSWSW